MLLPDFDGPRAPALGDVRNPAADEAPALRWHAEVYEGDQG